MNHNHGKTESKWNYYQKRMLRRCLRRGKLVAAVVAGMLSAPKRGRTAFSSDWVAAYCHGEKGGAPQYFNHDMEMAISKDVKSLNSNELNILSAEFCSNCLVTEQRFFSVCVFLRAIICARSRTLDALAPEPIGIDKTKRELWQSGHDNFHASNCRDKYSFTTAPQKKCAEIMMTASAREIKTLFWFVQTLTTIRSVKAKCVMLKVNGSLRFSRKATSWLLGNQKFNFIAFSRTAWEWMEWDYSESVLFRLGLSLLQ